MKYFLAQLFLKTSNHWMALLLLRLLAPQQCHCGQGVTQRARGAVGNVPLQFSTHRRIAPISQSNHTLSRVAGHSTHRRPHFVVSLGTPLDLSDADLQNRRLGKLRGTQGTLLVHCKMFRRPITDYERWVIVTVLCRYSNHLERIEGLQTLQQLKTLWLMNNRSLKSQ